MRIYCDIDGTLTTKQAIRQPAWTEMVIKIRAAITEGHEVALWSGGYAYAAEMGATLGIIGHKAALGKPQIIIDNEPDLLLQRFRNTIMTPEEFLNRPLPPR
jgi:hypothetical protein